MSGVRERATYGWAIEWRSKNRLDGETRYFMCDSSLWSKAPEPYAAYRRMLFETRAQARAYNKARNGDIAKRKDLRSEPHGWRMPRVVKVKVTMAEVKK
jgi:hypothetical protein